MSSTADSTLKKIAHKMIVRQPTGCDLAIFLSGLLEGVWLRQQGLCLAVETSLQWYPCLRKGINCNWTWTKEHEELGISLLLAPKASHITITPYMRTILERFLKDAI